MKSQLRILFAASIGLPFVLSQTLARADIQFSIPLPTPTPPPAKAQGVATPRPIKIATDRPAVYVLAAVGGDTTMGTALAVEVTMRIAPQLPLFAANAAGGSEPMLIPEPTWTLDDLAEQCRNQPAATRGAIIIGPVENDTGTWNAFVYLNGYMRLTSAAFLVSCRDSQLSVSWESTNFVQGRWQQGGIPLLPIALLGTYFIGHAGQFNSPSTITTTHAPDRSTSTVSNGGTSSTTTGSSNDASNGASTGSSNSTNFNGSGTVTGSGASASNGTDTNASTGSNSSTTTGAPTTITSTSTTTTGTTVESNSGQTVAGNTTLASSLGSLFAVSSTFADRAFPVSPQNAQSTYLKHAAGRLADDLFHQLKNDCRGTNACAEMFAPIATVSQAAPARTGTH